VGRILLLAEATPRPFSQRCITTMSLSVPAVSAEFSTVHVQVHHRTAHSPSSRSGGRWRCDAEVRSQARPSVQLRLHRVYSTSPQQGWATTRRIHQRPPRAAVMPRTRLPSNLRTHSRRRRCRRHRRSVRARPRRATRCSAAARGYLTAQATDTSIRRGIGDRSPLAWDDDLPTLRSWVVEPLAL
jgi:hypothetical protein